MKRSGGELSGGPPNKKALSSPEPPPEDDKMALGENVLLFQNKHLKKLLVEKTNQLETLNHKIGKVEQIKSKQEKSIIAFQQLLRSTVQQIRHSWPAVSEFQKSKSNLNSHSEWLSVLFGESQLTEFTSEQVNEFLALTHQIKLILDSEKVAREKIIDVFKSSDSDSKIQSLVSENEKIQKESQKQQKTINSLEQSVQVLETEKSNMEAKVEKIQNEIVDSEENSLKIQRKQIKEIDVLKQEIEKLKSGVASNGMNNNNNLIDVKPPISRDPSRSDLDSYSHSNFATTTNSGSFSGSNNFGIQQQQSQSQSQSQSLSQSQQHISSLPLSQSQQHISSLPPSLSSGNLNSFTSPTPMNEDEEDLRVVVEKRLQRIEDLEQEKTKLRIEVNEWRRKAEMVEYGLNDMKQSKFWKEMEQEVYRFKVLKDETDLCLERRTREFEELLRVQQEQMKTFEETESRKRENVENILKQTEQRNAENMGKVEQLMLEVSKLQQVSKQTQGLQELEKLTTIQKKDIEMYKSMYEKSKTELTKMRNQVDQPPTPSALKELEDLKMKINEFEVTIEEYQQKQKDWEKNELKLKKAIDTLQNSSKDTRDVAQLRANERILEQEVSNLKQDLANLKQITIDPNSKVTEGKIQRLEREIKDLRTAIHGKDQSIQSLMAELDSISQGFVDLEDQNARLAKQLTEKEDMIAQVMGDQIRHQQLQNRRKEENSVMSEKLKKVEEKSFAQQSLINAQDAKAKAQTDQIKRLEDELQQCKASLDAWKKSAQHNTEQITKKNQELEEIRSKLQKEIVRVQEEIKRNEGESKKNLRLTEELDKTLKKSKRTASVTSVPSNDGDQLGEFAKMKMTCSVCNEREKDAIITRCWHVFCFRCLKKNLEVRNRKCPRCHQGFSDNDVRQIYI